MSTICWPRSYIDSTSALAASFSFMMRASGLATRCRERRRRRRGRRPPPRCACGAATASSDERGQTSHQLRARDIRSSLEDTASAAIMAESAEGDGRLPESQRMQVSACNGALGQTLAHANPDHARACVAAALGGASSRRAIRWRGRARCTSRCRSSTGTTTIPWALRGARSRRATSPRPTSPAACRS